MTCDEARAAFSDLYDEALSGAPLVTVTQHLASCPACRAEWASFRKAMQAVADLGIAEPSPGFAARVRQQLEIPTRSQRVVQWLFLPLHVKVPIQAVAVLLVAFAGLLLYQRSPELRRATEPYQASSPPVAREAPTPVPPPAAEEPTRKKESPAPQADASKAEQAKPEVPATAAVAPPPQAPSEAEKDRGSPSLREEAKELEKTATAPESPKIEESSREPRAKSAEPGMAARRVLPSAPPPLQAPAPSAAPVQAAPSPGAEMERQISSARPRSADQLYSTALMDLGRQSYDQAIESLRAFIQQNPRDTRVPDARMRLADAYVAQHRYSEAILEYEAVAREFPDSPLVPVALYRQAQARLALGDQAGCQMLRDVADRYPQAPEAALAREALSTRCR